MTTATKRKLKLYVSLEHDDDTESPFDHDVFSLVSVFSDGRGAVVEKLEEFREKGYGEGRTWWWVSCYRHGGEHWFVRGKRPAGADHWDTTDAAGILYLDEHDPSHVGPTPQEAAESILEEYNRWCSGDCWYFSIKWDIEKQHHGTCPCCEAPNSSWVETYVDDYDSCGGIIGLEYTLDELLMILKSIKEENPETADRYEVVIRGDQAGRAYEGDVADKVREAGFRVTGDPEDEA